MVRRPCLTAPPKTPLSGAAAHAGRRIGPRRPTNASAAGASPRARAKRSEGQVAAAGPQIWRSLLLLDRAGRLVERRRGVDVRGGEARRTRREQKGALHCAGRNHEFSHLPLEVRMVRYAVMHGRMHSANPIDLSIEIAGRLL